MWELRAGPNRASVLDRGAEDREEGAQGDTGEEDREEVNVPVMCVLEGSSYHRGMVRFRISYERCGRLDTSHLAQWALGKFRGRRNTPEIEAPVVLANPASSSELDSTSVATQRQ